MAPKRSRETMASNPPPTGRSSKRLSLAKDQLSSLPDNLLHNIMSFLPARQAVQTCVLSRRWENSWRSMPCLDIDQQEFDAAVSKASSVDCNQAGEFRTFEEFVKNLLMFHRPASPLHRFRCRVVAHRCDAKAVERWIRHGLKCSPEVMEISWSSHAFVSGLPHSDSIAPRLKRLHLDGITLGAGFAQQIRSSYAVLEDLHLERCLLDSPEITSHTLKSLTITDSTAYFGTVLTITAPALRYLHLDITNWAGITVNEMMPSLVKASIRSKCHVASCKLLCSLVNVRMLELSGSNILSILHKGLDGFPTFHNLRTLLFDRCNLNEDFKTLGCFLNNAPSLKKLTLHYCELPGRPRRRHNQKAENLVYTRQYAELTVQCAKLKWTDIKNKLSGIWSNLQNSSITVTKV